MILGAAALCILVSLACITIMGPPAGQERMTASSTSPPPTETVDLGTCPVIAGQIIEANTTAHEHPQEIIPNIRRGDAPDESYISFYLISEDTLIEHSHEEFPLELQASQEDKQTHREIWDYFAGLIPPEERRMLGEFWIVTDGPDEILAAVSQTATDPAKWILEVDPADSGDYYSLTFTLMHEYGHLLTLGPDQVTPSQAVFDHPEDNDLYLQEVSACPNYFPGEGCAEEDSYINEFHARFWPEIHEQWAAIDLEQDEEVYEEQLERFYESHRDQFLTDYAVTHPAEDIAESFAFFVFSSPPKGSTIAEQKILFFNEHPDLVRLRTRILDNLCRIFPQ